MVRSSGATKNAAYAAQATRPTATAAKRILRSTPRSLLLQKIFAKKPQHRQKHHVKSRQQPDSRPLQGRLRLHQADAYFGAHHQDRRKQRQKQQRQEQFPHARLGRDGGERRANHGDPHAAQKERQQECRQLRCERYVEQSGEYRKHQQFGDQQEQGVGGNLGQEYRKRILHGKPQRAQRVIGLFAQKT